jgi:hypothetical protein
MPLAVELYLAEVQLQLLLVHQQWILGPPTGLPIHTQSRRMTAGQDQRHPQHPATLQNTLLVYSITT